MASSTLSFSPPIPMEPYAAGSTALRAGSADWVLLHKVARISDLHNTTTVVSKTADGQAVEVSFWLVDPPGVSYFSFNFPGLKEDDVTFEPYVVCAEAALVLFCVTLNIPAARSAHYFVYRAGPGQAALHLLPRPDNESFSKRELGLVHCGGDNSEHYAVVRLTRKFNRDDFTWQFGVYVFSSQTREWSRKVPLVRLLESDKHLFGRHVSLKQIKVGRSSLGWVHPLYGILLLRDIFDKNPVIEYIQYPAEASRPCITEEDYVAADYFRDITSCNDFIKFVDVEYLGPERSPYQLWEATTWNFKISENHWRKHLTVHVDSISVDQSYSSVLPELWDDKTQKLQLNKLSFYAPILSMQDDDLLYVLSKVDDDDDKAWVITVDMKQLAVEALAPFSDEDPDVPMYYPCAFPKYLTMTLGADMTNPVHKDFQMMVAKKCALEVLSTQAWLSEIDQCMESERSSYIHRTLLHCNPVPSLRFTIRAVVEYASYNGRGKSKAVDVCLRALDDFDLLLRKSLSDPSICTETIRRKINHTLQALDNVIASLAVIARGTQLTDASHQKGGKIPCDCSPLSDGKLSFDDYKMGRSKGTGDKLQQVRSSGKKTRRKRQTQAEDWKKLKRFLLPRMSILLLLIFGFIYICHVIYWNVRAKYPGPSVLVL